MKKTTLILSALVAATALADRTANRSWVEGNFVSRTNEWKLVERRHALLMIDLNWEAGGEWRAFELKASTNNFGRAEGRAQMTFWGISDEADGYAPERIPIDGMLPDRMLLFCPGAGSDAREWTRIGTTLDLLGRKPRRIAVIVSPGLCRDGGGWLGEWNGEIVWSYIRVSGDEIETDVTGKTLWRPVEPVKWYADLPEWAKQEKAN